MKLKFYILALVLISFFQVHAQQNPITITGSCSDSEVLGTYEYIGEVNGKASYRKGGGQECRDFTTPTTCENAPKRYNVAWDGSKWEWFSDINYIDCSWFPDAKECVPSFGDSENTPSKVVLATSTDDKPFTGWAAESDGCIPNITENETLSSIQNTFPNDLTMHPNPTDGNITIDLRKTNSAINVRLTNIIGQVIWTKKFYNASLLEFKIEQPSGPYFIEITNEKGEKAHLKVLKN